MPTINKTVDKTTVNGSETFIYTYNVSYSGLSDPATSGKLVDFFPSKIIYQLPPIGGQLVSINQTTVAGGKNVEFNFGSVNAGTSLTFTVSCQFGPGRVQNDTFTNVADLYADAIKVATATAPTVNLVLDDNFTLIKFPDITAPVRAGQEVTFKLVLQNLNDPGYRINNVVITDVLPAQLIPVLTFTPVGNDTSTNGYKDQTYDGKTGSFIGNTLNFTLPSYNGSNYTILFKATVANTVTPGQTIINTAKWTVSGTSRTDATTTFTIFEDKARGTVTKRAPLYAEVGKEIQYSVLASNSGTVPLLGFTMIDTIPEEINITKISFATTTTVTPTYSLFAATSDNPLIYKNVAIDIIGTSIVYDLASLIPVGGRVTSVKALLPVYNPVNVAASMLLYGKVSTTATPNKIITNTATIAATSTLGLINETDSASTTLNGKSILNITKSISPQLQAYYPLNEFMIRLKITGDKGMIFNPIISDLLPLGIDYVPGNEYYTYFDNLSFTNYISTDGNFPIPLPTVEVIKNYKNTGRTLLRFKFPNFVLLYSNDITVNFTAIVLLNPPNTFTNYGYSGNPGSNTEVSGTSYLDVDDLDGDSITNENLAQSNAITGAILTTSEFSLEKWAKGNLDTNFSKTANATAGGDVVYELNVTNNQSVNLKDIEIVDILPHIGDTGVILNTTPRGSQYTVYSTSEVEAKIINILGDPVVPPPTIKIEYSTSYDPIRFDENGTGTIGTGTWSLTPPADITTLKSIKVTTDPTVILKPYERLVVTLNCKTPVGVSVNSNAYNSYAVKANKVTGGVTTPMNPAEPNKVNVRISLPTLASIGNFVWNDVNGNGIYDVGEVGVNGITVELYDKDMILLATTVTANNNLLLPGYYQFTNLAAGSYYVKFIPFGDYSLTVQKLVVNGSKPNPATGLTNLITLATNEINTTINAGVVAPVKASIGNFVFNDLNHNGLYDIGEPGINGVTVELYSENMTLLATKVTANNNLNLPGYYEFTDLNAGKYFVKFIPTAGYVLTTQQLAVNGSKPNPTTGLTNLITLLDGETNNAIIAGAYIPAKASIGNFVFNDLNHNGLFDIGEPGVNGVTVQLYDKNMTLLATKITANNALNQPGYYEFTDLEAGEYYAKFIPFGDYILTTQQLVINGSKPNPATGLTNLITLTAGEVDNTTIAGVYIPEKASIGNLVFEDLNHNGIHDVGEPGINGVTVELYSENMSLLATKVTANDATNNPGFYEFQDLEAGKYFVKFVPSGDYVLTTQQLVVNGSKPNPNTGLTNLITLLDGETNNTIIAGIYKCTPPVINATNKCVHVDSAFDPMVGVTAFDCQSKNITDDIIITANNVDANIPGTYHVTYQVTDSHIQTTTKTITVRVCKNSKRVQSIIDIYESIALEQTALSHILNAEGEKIQKALEENYSIDNVLLVNKSVKSMIDTIARLEIVLTSKAELFKNTPSDCCK